MTQTHRQIPRPLDWEDVRCFAALARHRTLLAASRALNVNPEAVERRLASLEAALGYALFTRDGQRVRH